MRAAFLKTRSLEDSFLISSLPLSIPPPVGHCGKTWALSWDTYNLSYPSKLPNFLEAQLPQPPLPNFSRQRADPRPSIQGESMYWEVSEAGAILEWGHRWKRALRHKLGPGYNASCVALVHCSQMWLLNLLRKIADCLTRGNKYASISTLQYIVHCIDCDLLRVRSQWGSTASRKGAQSLGSSSLGSNPGSSACYLWL